ncbi:MAG: glycosyltransferase [Candidatus Aegiribacteria sp.]|nr:glycosyltransferase [Candidatus Aegiribacteria sp.]
MSSVLLVGDDGSRTSADMGTGACIARTIRFRNALISHGFDVSVCSPREGKAGVSEVRGFLARGLFDCIVAISPFPAEAVIGADPELPLWIDMNGMHPAEHQLESNPDGRSGERMLRILSLENMLLSRGDAFSTPSGRQTYAVCGELLLLGRNISSDNSQLMVFPIPHCSNEVENFSSEPDEVIRIISTGSFNLWFDEVMLFNALEQAMDYNSSIHFEAAGGKVPSSPEKYDYFCEMVAASRFRDRFLLHGWVSTEELNKIYSRASIATYTDIISPETLLGARTRVLDWVSRGIPVVCTEGAEISEDIRRHNLGVVVPSGDSESLANAFIALAEDSALAESVKHSQKEWCETIGSSSHVFVPLIRWCNDPARLAGGILGTPTVPPMNSFQYLKRLFVELSRSKGRGYAIKRLLRRIFRSLK